MIVASSDAASAGRRRLATGPTAVTVRGKQRGPAGPRKPHKGFPLTPHPNGQFCKKIKGRIYYFGTISDPQGALERYHRACAGLHSGRVHAVDRRGAATVRDLANAFLAAAEERQKAGAIKPRTFADYYRACETFVQVCGRELPIAQLTRDHLKTLRTKLGRSVSATTLRNRVTVLRSVFKFAYDAGMIDTPLRLGADFARPSRQEMRIQRASRGRRHFHADEIRKLLDAASPQFRAMVLLGINCALGNTDLARLRVDAIDCEHGWLDYPRPKTGVDRRCPLWPETLAAVREVVRGNQKEKGSRSPETAGLLFVTRRGNPFVRGVPKEVGSKPSVTEHDAIATQMKRLMSQCGIAVRGLGFYGLRHTFETIGGETGNQVAVNHIMGHAPLSTDMAAVYRQTVGEEPLRLVTEHVRGWLYGRGRRRRAG
jgi:integrase